MMRSPEKPLAVAVAMMFLALCYQLQLPQEVYAGMAGLASVGAAFWFTLEKWVSAWMPDSEFPNWLLAQMA